MCRACRNSLLAIYDLESVNVKLDRKDLDRRGSNMWRYRELLPVNDIENIVSLSESLTLHIKLKRVSKKLS